MKQAFRSLCATSALMLIAGAFSFAQAQTPSATPDPFVAQVTFSTAGAFNNPFASFAGEISANGRFVVIESNGDIATEKTAGRNNADGNREIFLLDYAQRRIFQITNTTNAQKIPGSPTPTPTPTPTPSPSASPTPTPGPTAADLSNVDVEVSNNQPVLSVNGRWIVFSSNASTPGSFDGNTNRALLLADGNQEVFLYLIPATTTVDLATGAEAPFVDLAAGTFTQVTDTPASRLPQPGSAGLSPFVAFDNRDATVNDDASVVSFVSSRNLIGTNTDFNPEVFIYIRSSATTTQVTNTPAGTVLVPVFNENPSLSGSGSVLAFISNANISVGGSSSNADGDAEIYLASVNTSTGATTVTRQVTKTKTDAAGATVNEFNFGRRMSRDGNMIAFESLANDPKADGSITQVYVTFVYDISLDTFTQVGPRTATQDILHFPTFTDYDPVTLKPASVVFASFLNFRPDGTIPEAGKESEGLNNTSGAPQIFLASIPVASTGPFTRLTNIPSGATVLGIRPFLSQTRRRLAFSLGARELGGGNPDGSSEVYYQLSPQVTSEPTASISLFTGASEIPVVSPSPTPSPSPFVVTGLAPGELAIARATVPLAPSAASVPNNAASELTRSPALPVELNGVSLSINGAAAGLYSVSSTQINFVVPIGLIPNTGTVTYPVVINIHNDIAVTGTAIRGTLVIVAAQPDLFTTTNGAGGRAVICNVTNSLVPNCVPEPFSLMSLDETSTLVPTKLEIHLTGVRNATVSQVTVTIGTTDITGSAILSVGPNGIMPGLDFIKLQLPSTLPTGADLPVIVKVGTATSRPADSAPQTTITP